MDRQNVGTLAVGFKPHFERRANGGKILRAGQKRWFCPDGSWGLMAPPGTKCIPLDGNLWCNPTPPFLPTLGGYINDRGHYCAPKALPPWAEPYRNGSPKRITEGQLGDVACTADDFQQGQKAVVQMQRMWLDNGKPAQFASRVSEISQKAQQVNDQWRKLPRYMVLLQTSTYACMMKDVGREAERVTSEMAAALRVERPAPAIRKSVAERVGTEAGGRFRETGTRPSEEKAQSLQTAIYVGLVGLLAAGVLGVGIWLGRRPEQQRVPSLHLRARPRATQRRRRYTPASLRRR